MTEGNTSRIRIPSRLLGVFPHRYLSAQVVGMDPSPAHGFLCDYLTDQGCLLRDALPTLADAITLFTSVPLCMQLSKAVTQPCDARREQSICSPPSSGCSPEDAGQAANSALVIAWWSQSAIQT
ncbi:hypothetical protein [Kitasatospora sp. NPDC048407]|uniref:hypothetical protein n=1 Tax=Kitasatospora sp. NPDC048407 TaxID=3364051 RepID=UPI003712B304